VHKVLCHHAKFGVTRISPAAGLGFCLFVCLSVTLLSVGDYAPDFAVKALEYRKDFDTAGLRFQLFQDFRQDGGTTNTLPASVRYTNSSLRFRKLLKAFLFV